NPGTPGSPPLRLELPPDSTIRYRPPARSGPDSSSTGWSSAKRLSLANYKEESNDEDRNLAGDRRRDVFAVRGGEDGIRHQADPDRMRHGREDHQCRRALQRYVRLQQGS